MTRIRKTPSTQASVLSLEAAAAAAAFLKAQEITTTQCGQCGTEISGVRGRYACGHCGWSNAWHEGHGSLPTAEDDPDWPGHKDDVQA